MAYRKNSNSRRSYNKTSRSTNSATSIKQFAFNLGRVQKGISNSNSQVHDSYIAGKNYSGKKTKKPLF